MLVDLSKKGTIILSHYRSGGTQLKEVIKHASEYLGREALDLRELDLDYTRTDIGQQIKFFFNGIEPEQYAVLLLNNNHAINFLYAKGQFDKLVEEYNVVYLEREDKEKVLLSLPLWERFIHKGLYDAEDQWTEDNMLNFHKDTLSNPIPYQDVYLGHHMPLCMNDMNPINYLNLILTYFLSEIQLLRNIQEKYNLHKLVYESFEQECSVLAPKYFPELEHSKLKETLQKYVNKKIPYTSSDYLIYYDEYVKEVFKAWDLNGI